MIYALFALLVLLFAGYNLKHLLKPQNYPPGPPWYPFIGCNGIVETMKKQYGSQWKGLSKLAKEYSTKVLGLKLGGELVIVVYGLKNIKQVFTGTEFEGRPDNFFMRLRSFGKRTGITSADGPLWKIHRQFTVKQLRNVGFGKTAMEKEIQKEMGSILDFIKNNNNKPIDPKSVLATAVMNVLWKYTAGDNQTVKLNNFLDGTNMEIANKNQLSYTFGKRERIKEEKLIFLLELLNARSKAFSMGGGWLNQMPWCRHIVPELSGYSLIMEVNTQIADIIEEAIKKHKNNSIEGNDFIYSFLEEMKENKDTFTEEQLRTICLDLIIAGSQTTSNVLGFAILVVLRNKMLQDIIYNEIKDIIGDKTPCWADNTRMTFTPAFLLEVHRYYNIVPLAGPRRVLSDATIDGYSIPKETTVLIALGDLSFDPTLWDDPYEFKPERFIDENGTLKNIEHLYPFGLGRRRCPGDSLAKSFIFIVFVGLLQNYRIDCSNGALPSDEPIIGLISAPRPYTAEFIPRK